MRHSPVRSSVLGILLMGTLASCGGGDGGPTEQTLTSANHGKKPHKYN